MATRRALRKLLGARHSLFRDPLHFSQQGGSYKSWPRFLNPSWSHDYHTSVFGRGGGDENEEKRRRMHLSLGARNMTVFGTTGFVGSNFSNSVRFCSSGTDGALTEGNVSRTPEALIDGALSEGNVSSTPEALIDAAHQVVAGSANLSPASEIAAATAESFPWTSAVQYIIYDVHEFVGLPWWLAISATTVFVRALVLPLVIYQVRSTARFALLRPELEQMKAEMVAANYTPEVVAENRKKMSELFAKHKTDPFTPLIGALLQGPIFMCFFFGLRTMAEKMESFKTGGALWFTDLTTPDDLFLLPLLTSATFLITVELGAAEGMQGQPNQKMIKNILRGLGVLFLPLTASFPKALFCYWITSNLWSLVQGAALRNRSVKTFLDIPDTSHLATPRPPPVVTTKPPPRKSPNDVSFETKKARRLAQ